MRMISALPADTLEKVLAFAEEAGVPRARLAAEAGIDLGDGAAAVPFADLAAAYEAAARLTGDAAFGLHIGERTNSRMYGLLGYLVANAETLGDALTSLVSYQGLWTLGAGFDLERRPGQARLRYWTESGVAAAERRQESEQMLCALLAFIRSAIALRVVPLEARFEHRAPAEIGEHQRIFGCRLLFGMGRTELVLSEDLLALPVPDADANLSRVVKRQAEAELGTAFSGTPFIHRLEAVAGAILLGSGDLSLTGLAKATGLGPRTLQRRLRGEGLSLRELVNRTRASVARRLLREGRLSLAEIAFRLGYSQTSAFHRAFLRWNGVTPRRFREKGGGAPD